MSRIQVKHARDRRYKHPARRTAAAGGLAIGITYMDRCSSDAWPAQFISAQTASATARETLVVADIERRLAQGEWGLQFATLRALAVRRFDADGPVWGSGCFSNSAS